MMNNISDNLNQLRQTIAQEAVAAGRDVAEITLLAVSKTRSADELMTAYQVGQRDFGENYVQEALQKMEALKDLDNVVWHFIGPIQSNKTRHIAENFSWVHSVDRLKIAKRLSEQRPASLPALNICLQVNISDEDSKSGCESDEVLSLGEELAQLPNVNLRGLMAIPKVTDSEVEQALALEKMQAIFQQLKNKIPELDTLSMGMSSDRQMAIKSGSTLLRLGTAIFGSRNYAQ